MGLEILHSLLSGEYDKLSVEDLKVIAKYPEVFGLKDDFSKKVEKLTSSSFDQDDYIEAINFLKDNIYPKIDILYKIDGATIKEEHLNVRFKEHLFEQLEQLDILKLCYFIDYIGYYAHKKHKGLHFFGSYRKLIDAYHDINMTISKSQGAMMAFKVFFKNRSRYYEILNLNIIDKKELIKCLKRRLKYYYYVLDSIAVNLAGLPEEPFEKKLKMKTTKKINFEMSPYFSVIQSETREYRTDRGGSELSFSMIVDSYYEVPELEDQQDGQ